MNYKIVLNILKIFFIIDVIRDEFEVIIGRIIIFFCFRFFCFMGSFC